MNKLSLFCAFVALSLLAIGCADKTPVQETPDTTNTSTDDDHGHDHAGGATDDHAAHKAPNGGQLIDLGREHKYHAELLESHENESITVFITDGDLKPLAIEQESVSLIMTAGESTATFELPSGKTGAASEFTSNDAEMMKVFETEGMTGKLRVTIDGKPFTGAFKHEHHGDEDGDDHGHSHDDEDHGHAHD